MQVIFVTSSHFFCEFNPWIMVIPNGFQFPDNFCKMICMSLKSSDSKTVNSAKEVLEGVSEKGRMGRLLPFLGLAFIASVAYVDPGNFATNIQGGAQFGYTLLWVIIASNLMAMLIQMLSAKLGIATGTNLAEQCRKSFPKPVV